MATEKSEFPSEAVELRHFDDANVLTPEPAKIEDLVGANENPYVPLESRPSSKEDPAEAEAAMRSLGLEVSTLFALF